MSEEKEERGELVLIGGAWVHRDREGRTFLSGNLGNARLLVFKNKFKKQGEKQPDYRVYVARKTKTDQTDTLDSADPDALADDVGPDDVAGANGGQEENAF